MATKTRTVNVRATSYDRFQAAVLRKHGKLRGTVQDEATRALDAASARLEAES